MAIGQISDPLAVGLIVDSSGEVVSEDAASLAAGSSSLSTTGSLIMPYALLSLPEASRP